MKLSCRFAVIFASLVLFVISSGADVLPPEETLPRYVCRWTDQPILVDGVLDESAWENAPVVTFLDATDGSPAVQGTEARILYNDTMILFSYSCVDSLITSTLTKRDSNLWSEEAVEAFISPTGDLSFYYEFEVNPLGALLDLTVKNNFNPDRGSSGISGNYGWNSPGIQWAAHQEKDGDQVISWSVEIAVPFADMDRSTPEPGEIWRVNLYRIDSGGPTPDEFTAWSPTFKKPAAYHHPQYFGFLEFAAKAAVKEFESLR